MKLSRKDTASETASDIRVLYFGSSKKIGLTYHLAHSATYFCKLRNVDFHLVSGESEQFEGLFDLVKREGIKHVKIHGIDEITNFFRCLIPFMSFVKKHQFQVIHAQTNAQLVYCILAKLFFGSRIVYSIHSFRNGQSWWKSALFSTVLSIVLNLFADIVIALSPFVQKHFQAYRLKSTFMPLGFHFADPPNAGSSSTFNIIFPGKFHVGKNHLWLVRTLLPFIKKNPDVRLYLPGDGQTWKECRDIVAANGLEENILLPGWVDKEKLDGYYRLANLAIIPSKSETFGHCIVEPMFYGLPILSTPVGVSSFAVRENSNGFIFQHNDSVKLIDSVNFLYQNRSKLIEFGLFSRKVADEEFAWTRISKSYSRLLTSLFLNVA